MTKGLVGPARGNLRLCSRQLGCDEGGLSQDSRPPLTWSFGPCPALSPFFLAAKFSRFAVGSVYSSAEFIWQT